MLPGYQRHMFMYWMAYCLTQVRLTHSTEPGCRIPSAKVSGFSRDGDILIGGLFPIHDARVYQTLSFREEPMLIPCQAFVMENFQWQQAMVFAIEEINRNPNLLPNITLGLRIHDSCMVIKRSLEGTFWMLTGQEEPIPNYQCWRNAPPAAIIGDTVSTRSIIIARILGLYRYPQISYSASSPLLSDRIQFPSFFRTIPSDDFQSHGLAQLVVHFGWTWVGLLADDDDYGQHGVRILQEELIKTGACIAFSESILTSRVDKNAFKIVQVVKNSTVNAIVIFSNDADLAVVLEEMLAQNVTGKVYIATEAWSTSTLIAEEKYFKMLIGTIGFAVHRGEMNGFNEYLTSLHPLNSENNIFLKEFWEKSTGCNFEQQLDSSLNMQNNKTDPCIWADKLESYPLNASGAGGFGVPYKIYNAVYAIALSLQDMRSCMPDKGPFHMRTCADILGFQSWQLLHYIKNVHLQPDKRPFFDEHGNPPAKYDIVNWQQSPQGTLRRVKVGRFDSSAPAGETLLINVSAIHWNADVTQVPVSVCSPSCLPGYRKVPKEGQHVCCFLCITCSQGEISNQTDSIECSKCPWDQWPNEKQTRCIQKIVDFLHYDEPLGGTLAAISFISIMVVVAILGLFFRYRNTPIVRANNCNLSYLLLLSLILCFLCSVAFIGKPSEGKCLFRQAAFGVTFAFCVSCILAKTIMVFIAFNATKPNSDIRKWVGPKLSYVVITVCTLIQVILCIFWLVLSPPYSQFNILSNAGILILECNEGSAIAFWCMLGYLALLASINFIVAFLARNLPDSFNDAKFITFSMLAFLSVWLSFVPAYLSTNGKYMVAMEIFAILSSSASLVACIFLPKCYIILCRSEMNTKESLMGRASGLNNKVKRM